MKKLRFVFLAVVLLVTLMLSLGACTAAPPDPPKVSPEAAPAPPQAAPVIEEAEWTVAIYLCGTDLESGVNMVTTNFIEILMADISDDINFIVLTGGTLQWNPKGYAEEAEKQGLIAPGAYIKPDANQTQIFRFADNKMELLHDYGENLDMGDPQTLIGFHRYVLENYPSKRLLSVIANHGFGPVEGIAEDEHTKNKLSLPDLVEAYETITALYGGPVDLVGLDACSMGNLETSYIMSPYADYMIASSEFQKRCWQNGKWLDILSGNPAMEAPELGRAIIDTFAFTFNDDGDWSQVEGSETLALIDLCENKMDNMMDAFNAMANELYDLQQRPDEFPYSFAAAIMAQKTFQRELVDLYDYTILINEYGKMNTAEAVLTALGTPPGETSEFFAGEVDGDGIIAYRAVGEQQNRGIGLSFWLPAYTNLHQSQDVLMSEFEIYKSLGISKPFIGYLEIMLDFKIELRPFTGDLEDVRMNDFGDFVLYYNDPFSVDGFNSISTMTPGGSSGNKTYLLGSNNIEYDWTEGGFKATVFGENWIALGDGICTARIIPLQRRIPSIGRYSVNIPAYLDEDHDNVAELELLFEYTSDPLIIEELTSGQILSATVSDSYLPDSELVGKTVETLLVEVDPLTNEPTGEYIINEPFIIGDINERGILPVNIPFQPLPGEQEASYKYFLELTDKKGSIFSAEREFLR